MTSKKKKEKQNDLFFHYIFLFSLFHFEISIHNQKQDNNKSFATQPTILNPF